MAVSTFSGGFSMNAAGDVHTLASGRKMVVGLILIHKITTNGAVNIFDGDGNDVFRSRTLVAGTVTHYPMPGGWVTDGVEVDAITAGTAAVYVFLTGTK